MAPLADFFQKSRRRADHLRALAPSLGMTYHAKDEYGLIKLLGDFRLFRRGHHRRITNLLEKRDGLLQSRTAIFDYRYTISSGNSSRVYRQTVFFVESNALALPQFLLKPEHFFHAIGKFLGVTQDIAYAKHPTFSDQYLIQGEHPGLVEGALPLELAQFFTVEKEWSLEGLGYYLVFYRHNRRLPPDTIRGFHDKGMKIMEMLRDDTRGK